MFSLSDIMQGNDGKIYLQSGVSPHPDTHFRSAQHDSRQIGPGDLFVAIKGARVDGHTFIPAVAQAGALGVLCSEPATDMPPHFLQFVVPDVGEALIATARVRAKRQERTMIIGITGSNGKTTTKEAVAAVLEQQAPTLKTYASYNNDLGLPLTVLRLEPQHRYAVLEMGAERVGELALLCSIVRPDWAIITNVGWAHIGLFGSPERIAMAKSEVVEALPANGMAILNFDDQHVHAMRQKTQASVLSYGLKDGAEIRGSGIDGDALYGHSFKLSYHDVGLQMQLQLPGKHGIYTALAASSAGFLAEVSPEAIRAALGSLRTVKGRGQIKQGPNGSKLVDDSYNANPQSVLAGIDVMYKTTALTREGKRWAILGDMLDLGQYGQKAHCLVGQTLVGKVDYLVAVGDQARYYIEGAREAGMPEDHLYFFGAAPTDRPQLEAAKQAAAVLLGEKVQSNDLLWLKASNSMAMQSMLESFEKHLERTIP
jgi:UDP-N-acetylmuramoyl-tripeptide--D-alanyl-D-alanine ligase